MSMHKELIQKSRVGTGLDGTWIDIDAGQSIDTQASESEIKKQLAIDEAKEPHEKLVALLEVTDLREKMRVDPNLQIVVEKKLYNIMRSIDRDLVDVEILPDLIVVVMNEVASIASLFKL